VPVSPCVILLRYPQISGGAKGWLRSQATDLGSVDSPPNTVYRLHCPYGKTVCIDVEFSSQQF